MTDVTAKHHAGLERARSEEQRARPGESLTVPPSEPRSYYGQPVLNPPVWRPLEIAGYFFLGGLAGASSALGAGAQLTGRPHLARTAKVGAAAAGALSMAALMRDLGRPERVLNMLRVFKPTSPMSVGSWVLSGYIPAAFVSAYTSVTGRGRVVGAAATATAAALGPAVASYSAALIGDTAVPAWHDASGDLPFVFTGSASAAAGGLGLLAAPLAESAPARRLALAGAMVELASSRRIERSLGMVGEPYRVGRGGALLHAGKTLTIAGVAGAVAGRRSRLISAGAGASLLAASACTRFGVFFAGMESARDPKYTVVPQRERVDARAAVRASGAN